MMKTILGFFSCAGAALAEAASAACATTVTNAVHNMAAHGMIRVIFFVGIACVFVCIRS
jgi:hypothetical protein